MRTRLAAAVAALTLATGLTTTAPVQAATSHSEIHCQTLSPFGSLNISRVRACARYFYRYENGGMTTYKVTFDAHDRYLSPHASRCSLLEAHAISSITLHQWRGQHSVTRHPTGGGCHFTRTVHMHTPKPWAHMRIRFRLHTRNLTPDVWYDRASQFNRYGTL